MSEASERLRDALVGVFPPYVGERLRALGVNPDDFAHSVGEAGDWLETQLTTLLNQPYALQRRGPLELFQEAMQFLTEELDRRGTPRVARDEATTWILPGDHFDLAPASSSALGEEVWAAHLAWGAEKARVLTGERN